MLCTPSGTPSSWNANYLRILAVRRAHNNWLINQYRYAELNLKARAANRCHGNSSRRPVAIAHAKMSRKDKVALGSQRESLSVNPLLVQVFQILFHMSCAEHLHYCTQSELGKPRRRCFTLPPSDFTYGMRSICLDGGASEGIKRKL